MRDELTRVTFTTEELRKLPRVHTGFFVASCLAANEIGLSLRLFLMALNTTKAQPFADSAMLEYAFCQFQMVERSLGAKLIEYFNLLVAYQTRCQRKKDKTFSELIDTAVT